jgi:MFS family permease
VAFTDSFRTLKERNAKLFFGGLLVSNVGTWAQATATTLLVKRLATSNPGTALGIAVALQFLPMLVLGAWAGSFADQHSKRRLTLVTQSLMLVQATALTIVDFTGSATLPTVYMLALALGIVNAMDNPARRGLVLELVEPSEISSAMSINTGVMTGSRIFGPAIAAWIVNSWGTSWCFLVNAVSFLAVLGSLLVLDMSKMYTGPIVPRGGTPVRDGFRLVWQHPVLRPLFVLFTVVSTFAFNYAVALPLLTDVRFHSKSMFGYLLAVMSVGSLTGSLISAAQTRIRMRWLLGSSALLGVFLPAMAWSPNRVVAFVLAVPVGIFGATVITAANSIAQTFTPPEMRGRMLALTAIAFLGSTPIGGPITGWVGDHVGAEWSLGYGGFIALGAAAWTTFVFWRRRRDELDSIGSAPILTEVV